ncbi:MAG: signal peptide peptidase SppA, partial [Methanobacteriota archaeon]
EADSLQLQEYLNDIYAQYRRDIAKSRGITEQEFDHLINEDVLFLAEDAKEAGLVDTLGRWVDIDKIISDKFGRKFLPIPVNVVENYARIDERWSEEPKIAIVYGLGPCALDEGIRARFLEKVFAQLKKDKSVKAIVFRVDSPGGDALASDLVTEAIKKVKTDKPVIVSQGFVAGSGGYWISMAGNKIFATPFSITGSIGVIGGWLYDQGFTGKLGLTADKVQVGKHADLGFGPTVPLLNLTVPYRNLTPEERGKIKNMFLRMYGEFVKKVADNRGLDEAHVRKIGEGHIYSGIDGKEIKLVDEIGDLHAAIEEAKKMAGISPDTPVDIIEIPKYKGLFKMPSPFGANVESELNAAAKYYIQQLSARPLVPMPMTPVAFWNIGL